MDIQSAPRTEALVTRAFGESGFSDQVQGHSLPPSTRAASMDAVLSRFRAQWTTPHEKSELSIRILRTAEQRSTIGKLREQAAFSVEKDLGVNLAWAESIRDELGIVAAFYRGSRLFATMRVVPVGHRLTAIENLSADILIDKQVLGQNSWEIGRTVMASEDRDPDLLSQCMVLAFCKLIELEEVDHLQATTTRSLARLWRRFGFEPVAMAQGASGERYVVIHATKTAVEQALRERRVQGGRGQ